MDPTGTRSQKNNKIKQTIKQMAIKFFSREFQTSSGCGLERKWNQNPIRLKYAWVGSGFFHKIIIIIIIFFGNFPFSLFKFHFAGGCYATKQFV